MPGAARKYGLTFAPRAAILRPGNGSEVMTTQSLIDQAVALHRGGRLADAEQLYRQALAADPRDFAARHFLGVIRAQQGRPEEGLAEIEAALALRPDDAEALLNRANMLKSLGRATEALAGFTDALAARPGWPQALNNRGTVLQALERFDEALADYDAALAAAPNYPEALNNRGSVLQDLKRPAEALTAYDQALRLDPRFAAAFNNRGSALLDLRRFADALGCFDRALALRPNDAETLSNRGNALQGLMRQDEAVASYDRALAIRPDFPEALNNRGSALQELKRHAEALASFDAALETPGQPHAFGGAAMAALNLCDWKRAESIGAQIERRVAAGEAIPPWTLTGYTGDEKLLLACARNVIRLRFPAPPQPLATVPYGHDRIRLAYISSDFCHHPVATQIAELIEKHDHTRFEVIGISTGMDDGSAPRRRLIAGFDAFHNVHEQSPQAIAALIRKLEVDVLVDLNGHTKGDNLDAMALRPAPVQATWLGYAGTTGADFVDYVIADAIVAPDPSAFSEKIAHLPGSFFVTDATRDIGKAPTRRQAGLPTDGFVFCSFNNNWKITAPVFAIWMRLLGQLPGSVLWLKRPGDAALGNLQAAAREHGIDPARLVLADNAPLDVHLARYGLADLFLDTLPYNAHATSCDALWGGLPVLTCKGTAFAGRVAASLLHAARLPELITETPQAYEALALELARDPARLKGYRDRLAKRDTPLFDTTAFARKIEAAYTEMLAAAAKA
jgi:predicted O-linked N-acetylglucosamine transferase (SPINDLY family)